MSNIPLVDYRLPKSPGESSCFTSCGNIHLSMGWFKGILKPESTFFNSWENRWKIRLRFSRLNESIENSHRIPRDFPYFHCFAICFPYGFPEKNALQFWTHADHFPQTGSPNFGQSCLSERGQKFPWAPAATSSIDRAVYIILYGINCR